MMKKLAGAFIAFLAAGFIGCSGDNTGADAELSGISKSTTTASSSISIIYKAKTEWLNGSESINIHYNNGNGWTNVPGVAMTKHATSAGDSLYGYATYTVADASKLTFCFNYNGSEWDNNSGSDYSVTEAGEYKVENGTITKIETSAYGDVYFSGVYPDTVLGGMPVQLYRDGSLYTTATITWTTTHGIYANFKNLPAGSYKAVLDNYSGSTLYSASAEFTVNPGDSWFSSPDVVQVTTDSTQSTIDVYFYGVYPSSTLSSMPVNLYRNGALFSTSTITSTTTHGTYATFKQLPVGEYRAELNNVASGIRYKGETTFTVESGSTYVPSKTIEVSQEDATAAQGDVYWNFSSDIYPDYLTGGMMVRLYKDGSSSVYAEKAWSYSNTNGTSCRFYNLSTGSYKAVVNETIGDYNYYGETTITVTQGMTQFQTVGINLTKTLASGITIYYKNVQWVAAVSTVNCHYNAGNGWTAVPGVAMTKHTSQYDQWLNYASIEIAGASSLTFCFNQDGTTWDNNNGSDYTISGKGVYTVDNGVITKIQ